VAYEAYKKFTQFNTFSHFIALCVSPYPTQRGLYAPPTPTTDQYFTLFCIYWSQYIIVSPELPQALNRLPLYNIHTLTHIHVHSLIHVYATLYQAAGPLPILQYTVKYHMDNRLLSLLASITLVTIWYVIYIWLLTRSIGSLSGSCIFRLQHSSYHTHTVWRP
jgi:hypothetical protein